jgi:hypothetical protein
MAWIVIDVVWSVVAGVSDEPAASAFSLFIQTEQSKVHTVLNSSNTGITSSDLA